MKEIMVNEPQFAAEFKCVGNQCIDHCCQGWDIVLDKNSVNKYLKSPSIEIRNIASESIEMVKKSHQMWAKIKFAESNVCGFMDEHKLCKVYTAMGPSALSSTCTIYPRGNKTYKNEINKSLSLSCPEATRLLLTSNDAMQMHLSVQLKDKLNKSPTINQWDKLINLMSIHLIHASEQSTEQGLYAIASLVLFAQKNPQDLAGVEAFFECLMRDIEQGVIAKDVDALQADSQLKWSLLLRLQVYLGTRKSTRSLDRFNGYMKRLVHIQTREVEDNNVSKSIERLDNAWSSIVQPWLSERPHIMRNYMHYRLYTDQFPESETRSPISWLYLLTAEWFLIKSLISATAEIDGKIDEQNIIDIIYSFHAITKHSKAATDVFFAQIEQVKVNDDISLLYLLK